MKHLSILALDDQYNLSTIACMAGTHEVFSEANTYWSRSGKAPRFKIEFVAATKRRRRDDALFSLRSNASIADIGHTDLIVIPSSLVRSYDMASKNNRKLIDWVRERHEHGAELASMCTGIFLLASTGLLEGKTCSTHWAVSDNFRALFPGVDLQTDKLITDEAGIYTNGGAYSFLHLLLYLVEKHYDRMTAIHCAKVFQIDMDRDQQAGFAIFNGHKRHDDDLVLKAQAYIEKHYEDRLSMEDVSARFNIGRRSFDRRFIRATGLTPLDYLQRVKVEAAKKNFEVTGRNVNEVMYAVGYTDAKAFRDVFSRITGMAPIEYRSKYNRERAQN